MKQIAVSIWNDPKAAKKFLVALGGAVGIAVSVGVLPQEVSLWVAVLGPFFTAAGVYKVTNEGASG